MANTDPLAQLKDIHLPSPIGSWPLAPGWYLLSALTFFLILMLIYWCYKKHRHALAKKDALTLLKQYRNHYNLEQNAATTSARISELLRRVALVYYPRDQVAHLHGEEWILFLNQTSTGIDFAPVKNLLLDVPFRTMDKSDLNPLFNTAQLWIKQRNVPCSH